MKISLGSYEILVNIVYKNNKNIYFRFDDKSNLIVTCPKRTYEEEIVKLIHKNEDSLIKMYEKSLERKKYNDEYWLLGKKYNVIYDNNMIDVKIEGNNIIAKDEETLDKFTEDKINEVFTKEAHICEKCFSYLPEYSLIFKNMRTRWGVCDRRKKTVTLNKELIKKDVDLLDYVIIHEFSHFYEGNHSKKFWDIVEEACPNSKEKRKRLRYENN